MHSTASQDPGLKVFVYGTLRSGASNHFRMAGATFVGAGTIRARMYRIDWFPGLKLDPAGERISGEIYQVTPSQLADLDAFEGVAAEASCHSEYLRVPVQVTLTSGQVLTAWVWEWNGPVHESERITHGDWLKDQPQA
jgi:gamma-glutamylcyclotransferase (GGCT)/AIG2-like uncharacterized protein YtfP